MNNKAVLNLSPTTWIWLKALDRNQLMFAVWESQHQKKKRCQSEYFWVFGPAKSECFSTLKSPPISYSHLLHDKLTDVMEICE